MSTKSAGVGYLCACGCLHGWITHPLVTKVDPAKTERLPMESSWVCPGCGRRHRTADGELLKGRPIKEYRQVAVPDVTDLTISMSQCPMTGEMSQSFTRPDGTVAIFITPHGIRFPEQEHAQ